MEKVINKDKIVRVLKYFNVPFWTSGTNVSVGSVNVRCPFCSDSSNHCGIFEDSLLFHCWRCNTSGSLVDLLQELSGFSWDVCRKVVEEAPRDFKRSSLEQIEDILAPINKVSPTKSEKVEIDLPEYFELITYDTSSSLLDRYLEKRGIELSTVIQFGCGLCQVGYYMNRMILPVYFEGKLVSYQAADITGRAKVKYDTAPGRINDYLYNYDVVEGRMLLVEGIFDAWRLGEASCATFGVHLTDRQITLILRKKLRELVFCWDSGTWFLARQQSKFFQPFIEKVRVVKFPNEDDPDSFGRDCGIVSLLKFVERG